MTFTLIVYNSLSLLLQAMLKCIHLEPINIQIQLILKNKAAILKVKLFTLD